MDVKLHTRIKHLILGYYYGVWKNIFKSGKPYSLFYVDLYAGDGNCECIQMPDDLVKYFPKDTPKSWLPPYFSLMENARDTNYKGLKCIFNDIDESRITSLKSAVSDYSDYLLATDSKDANDYYKTALNLIEKQNRPSLFYLDPTNHKDLRFSTIQGIANFENIAGDHRKPELIINLMVNTMLMTLKRNNEDEFQTITNSLGTDEWVSKLADYEAKHKTHELFRDIFLEQLHKLGYYTTYYYVVSTANNSPVYYLIFATYRDDIYKVHENMRSRVEKLMENEWVAKNFEIQQIVSIRKTGQTLVSDYDIF